MADNTRVRKAAGAAGPATAKRPKADHALSSIAPSANDQASTGTSKIKKEYTTSFAWAETANEVNAFKRLEAKEEAFHQGLQCAERIRSRVIPVIGSSSSGANDTSGHGAGELANWVAKLDDLKKQDTDFRIYIGFAGVTGAGKTSAINTIIGFRDLLPSSNEAAATAVPVQIAYNDDPNPGTKFKADVTFRTEDDIRQDLDAYYDALRCREEMQKAYTSASETGQSPPSSPSKLLQRLQDLEDAKVDVQDLTEMVKAVFGLDEDQLKTESTESLLASHPDMRALLGTVLHVESGDPNEFSDKIKQYMDSVPACHGPSGVKFAAWPLIVEVKVFVRSPVLKGGVVLVDLPGLADSMASRAAVAEKYFSKLAVTAIVAPVTRASDEQTAVNLMSQNQQLCMQMDGKFHKKSFCVILSKMDDINAETYIKHHEESQDNGVRQCRKDLAKLTREYQEIQKEFTSQKQQVTSLKSHCRRLRAEEQNAASRDAKAFKAVELKKCEQNKRTAQAELVNIGQRLQLNQRQARTLRGRILHWCIQGRNRIVHNRIQADFEQRQKLLAMANRGVQNLNDGTLKTFPISSSAYWDSIDDVTQSPVGFPALEYTGIPALKHWLRYAAIPDREKHLDMGLNTLHMLFNQMQVWSSFDPSGEVTLTKKFLNDVVLKKPLDKFEKSLNTSFNKLCKNIKALDPLKNKDGTLANSKQRCIEVVTRWASKNPSNLLDMKKMHWSTYNACVKKNGGPFYSMADGTRRRYAWIETLCNIFYTTAVDEWNRTFHEQIPALQEPTGKDIDELWAKMMRELGKNAISVSPKLAGLLDSRSVKLNQIEKHLKDLVTMQFDKITAGARKAHRTVNKSVAEKFKPAFNQAKKETGKGMFARQQIVLVGKAQHRGTNMFNDSTERIASHLGDQMKSLNKDFHRISAGICNELRDLIAMMLNLDGIAAGDHGDTAVVLYTAVASKAAVQRAVRHVCEEWAATWRVDAGMDIHADAASVAIPEDYHEPDDALNGGVDSDESDDEVIMGSVAMMADSGLYF